MTESLLFCFFLTLFAVMLPSTPLTLPISSHLPEWHVPLAFWFWKLIQNSSLQNSLSCLSPEGFLMEQQEGDCFCLSFTATFPAHWKTVCHDIRGTGKAYTTWVSRSLLYDTGKSEWSWNCVSSHLSHAGLDLTEQNEKQYWNAELIDGLSVTKPSGPWYQQPSLAPFFP